MSEANMCEALVLNNEDNLCKGERREGRGEKRGRLRTILRSFDTFVKCCCYKWRKSW